MGSWFLKCVAKSFPPLDSRATLADRLEAIGYRRCRGSEAFYKYVTETLGAKHRAIIVSECGHNNRCIFTTDAVFPALFP